mgnify:CR=1 FL=1
MSKTNYKTNYAVESGNSLWDAVLRLMNPHQGSGHSLTPGVEMIEKIPFYE